MAKIFWYAHIFYDNKKFFEAVGHFLVCDASGQNEAPAAKPQNRAQLIDENKRY